ncbi:hypothetical protein BCJMU51_0439 [Bacillus cereus]|nr:hypothetical protein BCM0045_0441 [Bacillus cereus]BCB98356.1 hypothetical protein BCM0057_0439 [Bacillus cereus]BCC21849.1 hypothetical protein BCM0079_0442 [Bacillus cereus]BCC33460.1 hypothetical protein BCM0105_0450 [Bacillus cereus]BCC39272.1 hypothetical protein BCJMU01_0439 [Bacillus cereus]
MELCINSTNLSQVYILQRTLNVRIVDIFLKIVDNVDIVVNIPTLLFNENAIFMWISLYLREQ